MNDTTEDPVGDDLVRRIEDGICWITLNRPDAGNAMTQFMRDRIADWVTDASADLFVRAVVITAAGDRAFCTGADLRGGRLPPRPKPDGAPDSVVGEGSRMIRDGWQRLVSSILDCEKPVDRGRQRHGRRRRDASRPGLRPRRDGRGGEVRRGLHPPRHRPRRRRGLDPHPPGGDPEGQGVVLLRRRCARPPRPTGSGSSTGWCPGPSSRRRSRSSPAGWPRVPPRRSGSPSG